MIHSTALVGEPPEHRDWQPGAFTWDPYIHPTARIGAFVTVDAGLRGPTRIMARTWLMKHVHVGHDAEIGPDCELAPGVVIGGHVKIGKGVRIGVNACVRPFVEVGDGVRIGAGAVVVKNVPPGEVWVGNPARPLRQASDPVADGWAEWWEARERQKATAKEVADYVAGVLTRCD